MNRDIPALTGIRAVAALWVLTHHLSHSFQSVGGEAYAISKFIGAAGFMGVDIFFVLSGFILAHNYSASGVGRSPYAYLGFLWKRLARIYPVHIAALVLFCVFLLSTVSFHLPYSGWDRLNWTNLLGNLMLTHAWAIPIPKSWNVVSWSISAEWAAYLCFPVFAVLAGRLRSISAACGLIILLFCALASNAYFSPYGGTMALGMVRIAVEFPAGVLVHRIWTITACRTSPWFDVTAVVSGMLLIVGGNAVANTWGAGAALVTMPILACVLIYSLAGSASYAKRVLSSALMNHLGRVSYAFYMVHLISIGAATAVALKYNLYSSNGPMIALLLGAVAMAYACAYCVYRFIEEPTRRWMIGHTPINAAPQRWWGKSVNGAAAEVQGIPGQAD